MIRTPIQNCRFKFLSGRQSVYCITRCSKHYKPNIANTEYYSAPLFDSRANIQNVLIAHVDSKICEVILSNCNVDTDYILNIQPMTLESLQDLVEYLRMPALVITAAHCDILDESEHIEAHYIRFKSEVRLSIPRITNNKNSK